MKFGVFNMLNLLNDMQMSIGLTYFLQQVCKRLHIAKRQAIALYCVCFERGSCAFMYYWQIKQKDELLKTQTNFLAFHKFT